jgi:hypothetical protein
MPGFFQLADIAMGIAVPPWAVVSGLAKIGYGAGTGDKSKALGGLLQAAGGAYALYSAPAAGAAGAAGATGKAAPMVYGSPEMLQAGAELGMSAADTLSLASTSLGGMSALELYAMDTAKSILSDQFKKWAVKQVIGYIGKQFGGDRRLDLSLTGAEGNLGWLKQGMGDIAPQSYGFPARNGLDYVPYDNYPARLHEGERVQTKEEAASGRGPMHIHVEIDGREIGLAIASQTDRNPQLVKAIRRLQ